MWTKDGPLCVMCVCVLCCARVVFDRMANSHTTYVALLSAVQCKIYGTQKARQNMLHNFNYFCHTKHDEPSSAHASIVEAQRQQTIVADSAKMLAKPLLNHSTKLNCVLCRVELSRRKVDAIQETRWKWFGTRKCGSSLSVALMNVQPKRQML